MATGAKSGAVEKLIGFLVRFGDVLVILDFIIVKNVPFNFVFERLKSKSFNVSLISQQRQCVFNTGPNRRSLNDSGVLAPLSEGGCHGQ